ncbi:beta-galactosidase [Cytophagaceae bacterium DM2B3-1]|uniref:Beta-galactosidase n=1 Tax=Xanthocytophaga flava TaxID=3048013 RepID=A0ABT7CWI5_9BACT|nr:beta-galactosidase [Xanthocytophaga flavus]MDJ1469137.1 beta-galactosidase [Xanthocytophaga flavus]MDJ1497317.1 beta-galactosidase [Xanthocytophaga flavus]
MQPISKIITYILLPVFLLGIKPIYAQKQTFEIKNGQFLDKGKPVQIHSGEMHYARIPKPYWRHRLQMLKAMGLNTVATYVFWNYHNTAPGVWDFTSENRNLAEFIKLAKEEGLYVILRPGPYACAEWEFGGYPWWLQKNKDLVIRTNNKPFLDSCKVYINKLAEQVSSLQVSKGGPIVMVQVENEFGSYVSQRQDIPMEQHRAYNQAIQQMLTSAGFTGPFFTSDGSWLFEGGAISGILPTANGEGNIDNLKKAVDKYHDGKGPYIVAEFYPGWLDHWAEPFVRIGTDEIVKQTEKYLQNGVHFNFYMAHGGTNFGFTSGANYNEEHDIQPDITSYDYDAPVSESGWATPKYMALRELMKKYVKYPIPAIPAQIPVITIPDIPLSRTVELADLKKDIKPVSNDSPLTFEALNQGYGYVLYSKRFTQPLSGTLHLNGLRDYALVFVNGKKIGELNRVDKKYDLPVTIPFNGTLEILVENLGRINYGAEIPNNTKGIISPVLINDFEITGSWQMYSLPLTSVPNLQKYTSKNTIGKPTFYTGTFELDKIGDTFLNMSSWGKGIVFINGHHLGRYWNAGPQQTLYVPGCWLTKGKNEVVIFEQQNDVAQTVLKTVEKPVLDK